MRFNHAFRQIEQEKDSRGFSSFWDMPIGPTVCHIERLLHNITLDPNYFLLGKNAIVAWPIQIKPMFNYQHNSF